MELINHKKEQEQERYLRVAEKVKKMKEFYSHLTVFIIIMPFIIFINLKLTPQFQWFWFSLLGWGIGLGSHAFQTFDGYKIFLGKDWEQKKIEEILRKEKRNGR